MTTAEIETELRSALADLLREHCGSEALAAFADGPEDWDRELWGLLVAMGIPGLAVPSELGGEGAGYALAVAAQEELGRRLAPVPTVSMLAVQAALTAAGGEAAERWLPRTSTGELTAALVVGRSVDGWTAADVRAEHAEHAGHTERTERAEHAGHAEDGGWTLDGEAPVVAEAAGAGLLLVVAATPDGRPVLLAVETGSAADRVRTTPVESLDPTRPLAAVRFDRAPAVPVADADRCAAVLESAERAALLALSADAVGVAAEALELAVEHARTRRQFGRPIGSFQAVSHRCADMLIAVESARALVVAAAVALDEAAPDAGTAVRLAAAEALDAAVTVAQGSLQVHGGMGFTWEHPAHRYLRRAKAAQALIALPDRLRERVADELLVAVDRGWRKSCT